jgi:hypothetical protein
LELPLICATLGNYYNYSFTEYPNNQYACDQLGNMVLRGTVGRQIPRFKTKTIKKGNVKRNIVLFLKNKYNKEKEI